MAKAQAVEQEPQTPIEEAIERAGDIKLMMIARGMWETLFLQGQSEGLEPGQVLDKALRQYLEAHGSKEAVDYLHAISKRSQ